MKNSKALIKNIKNGGFMTLPCFSELKQRELIFQNTNETEISELLNNGKAVIYGGFDPTAQSLHIGNFLQLTTFRRMQEKGNKVILLLGGATGMIGDPSGKSEERNLLDSKTTEENCLKFKAQMEKFLSFEGNNPAILVNNLDWFQGIGFLEFLRDVGKYFSVNEMVKRDSVKARFEREDSGISYTEFSYMLLQAYDFLHLHKEYGCNMQMGGSDQWGNIVSGVDLVRRVTGNSVHGITLPLLLDQNGKKMGKTEKGALWLNESFTSPYAFYQYWLNRPDQNCASLLNKLSFVSMEKISTLLEGLSQGTREAQKVLAEDLTIQVHGRENFERALKASESLFGKGDPKSLDSKAFRWLSNEIPSFTLKKEDFQSQKAMDLMALTELSKSKGQAKKDISQGALSVNGEKIMDPFFLLSNLNPVGDNFFLLKKGKKNFCLLEIAC